MYYFAKNYIISNSLRDKFCGIELFVPIMITGFTDNCVKDIRFTNWRDFFENPIAPSTIVVYVGDRSYARQEWGRRFSN